MTRGTPSSFSASITIATSDEFSKSGTPGSCVNEAKRNRSTMVLILKKRSGAPEALRSGSTSSSKGCSVTAVLFGAETYSRPWVKYEIEQSHKNKMGILAIDIHNMRDPLHGTDLQGRNPLEHWQINGKPFTSIYRTYDWVRDDGYNNIASWIEVAARNAGR